MNNKNPRIYVKRSYRKLNKTYWYGEHYTWKYIILALMTLFTVWALINFWNNQNPLVSPVVINPVKQVYAESVSCENPKGYLECQAYAGKITWEQHDRISKIINCESRWNPDAYHVNKNGTVDLGLVQINSIHKNISNHDKLDFKKAIDWMIAKINKDGGYGAWVCSRL